jgi:hypothetical protein
MGGDVSVESEPGEGSTFTLTFMADGATRLAPVAPTRRQGPAPSDAAINARGLKCCWWTTMRSTVRS